MVTSPPPSGSSGPSSTASGPFRRMTLRESLRRVGNRLRQSAGRKCKTAVEPTGVPIGPTVKRCRLDYERLASVYETPERVVVDKVDSAVGNNSYEVVRGDRNSDKSGTYEERNVDRSNRSIIVRSGDNRRCDSVDTSNKYEVREDGNSDRSNRYEVERGGSNSSWRNRYEVVREERNNRNDVGRGKWRKYEVRESNGDESNRYEERNVDSNRYEVVREDIRRRSNSFDTSNKYEVVRESRNRFDKSNRYESIAGRSNSYDDVTRGSNPYEVIRENRLNEELRRHEYEAVSNRCNRYEDPLRSNKYEVIQDENNSYESIRGNTKGLNNYEILGEKIHVRKGLDSISNRYEVIRDKSNSYEVLRNIGEGSKGSSCQVQGDKSNSYEEISDFIPYRKKNEEKKGQGRRSGVTWEDNYVFEVVNDKEPSRRGRRSCLKEIPVNTLDCDVETVNERRISFGDAPNDCGLRRRIGGSIRSGKKIREVLSEVKNINDDPIRKKKVDIQSKHNDKESVPRNEYEVVRKDKKKKKVKRRKSVGKDDKKRTSTFYDNPVVDGNKYEVKRDTKNTSCYENTLVDDYLNLPENKGTLNPAFEDFTLKSNLAPPKKSRAPLQEITIPLDDSFKENRDPNITVKRKRKYSVRFEIDEEVEEEVCQRRFGNVLIEENRQRPSILKTKRHLIEEEDNDSTEELLIRNYELLTKDGCCISREESNTSKFVRKKKETAETSQEEEPEEEISEDKEEDILPLPVVSLYAAPEDRMGRKKSCRKSKKPSENFLVPKKNSSSDIKVLGINTTDSLNQPSTLRTDRLAKIVQKFGPEVLMAMGEEGGDSVLAQFKKTLERPKQVRPEERTEKPEVPVVEETEQRDVEEPRRGKKRKYAEDIYVSVASEGLMEALGRSASRKKLHHIDIHLHALFAAVEHGHVEKAKTILESTDVDVNSVNSDGLTPLDVAVLSSNRALTKVLLAFGAREGNKFGSPDKLLAHLRQLAAEAERRVGELGGGGGGGEEGPRSAPPYPPASDKTLALWERRCKGLNKMIQGFEQARPPDVPFLVAVDVTGSNSVSVRFLEPDNSDSPPCTKFRVEWSLDPDFTTIAGHREVVDIKQTELTVDNLAHGQRHYFRAACGNLRGYSHYRLSQPDCVVPSSWRDMTNREERLPPGGLALLDRLFAEVRSSRPDLKGLPGDQGPGDTPLGQRRKKTTIKQLFTAASKFQKHLRRGVFLSCLLYHEDKVLVTNEDFLPVIEVDETYPGSIYHDFHWLLKVACTWDDVKWLRQDMEKSLSSSAVHFRIKLLQAAAQMQTALSLQDLGQLYHKPLRDSEGTIVICTVNYVSSPKAVSVLNSRWLPLGKLSKRSPPGADANIADILMSTIQDQITYHQVSSIRLPRGLYLAYLKMRSCVDLLQVLVPSKSPNVPPHCKIRDNPHVTMEEWDALVGGEKNPVSEHQKTFVEQVAATARRLFTYMEVSSEDAAQHRLYDVEVVEISPEVSLLMVVPPVDSACSAPGQREILLQRPDLLPLPVQVFEMVHLGTYRHQIVQRYSRLSCIIELDMALASHSQREAFSNTELTVAKERLARLEALQAQLNAAWKQCRWLLDVLAFARDRASHSPSSVARLLACSPKRPHDCGDSHNGLLQPPDPKAVKSRGSWPGPGTGRMLGAVTQELSRSEQHLSGASPPPVPVPPRPPSPPPLQVPLYSTVSLPPSRSEDTLVHSRGSQSCSVSVTTSPLLTSRPQFGSGSLHSLSSDDSASVPAHSKSEGEEEGATVPNPSPGILQVYAAYDTGLAAGTSLKLHVSPRTSAREVVDLVVKQLNMAVVLKGKDGPIYPADQLHNFCLVAVIGARERCLRDDFKPLQLQNPWKKGRLYVRQKHDVLAALEHSSRHSAFL